MNIVFINPELRPGAKRRQLPVGLAYIMTATKKAGYDFDLIDMDIEAMTYEELENRLGRKTYDVYAFGCMVTGFRFAKRTSELIRRINPSALIVAGNSVASSIPDLLLDNTEVDVAVMDEGDVTFVELLRAMECSRSLEGVQGLVFKNHSIGAKFKTPERPFIENLDSIGFPDWTLFDLKKYAPYGDVNVNNYSGSAAVSYPLNAARGCPFSCTFCYFVFKGRKYRRYSGDAIQAEVRRLHDVFGCNYVAFWDELTFTSLSAVREVVDKLKKLPFTVTWEATTRGNLFRAKDVDLVKEMKVTGCDSLSYSLESGNPEILKAMDKKMLLKDFYEHTAVIWRAEVTPLTSVIFGYPQETRQSIRETLDVCRRCQIYPSAGFLLPLPGTPIYEEAKKMGKIGNEVDYMMSLGDRQDFSINLTSMSDRDLVDSVTDGLLELATELKVEVTNPFKTVTYRRPKDGPTLGKGLWDFALYQKDAC
jgi:anaerobic magnesium-protoporphyrin IX monomethyl ester cyclase